MKMRRLLAAAAVAGAALWSCPGQAGDPRLRGEDLRSYCARPFSSKPTDAINYAFCEGYILGVAESFRSHPDIESVCLPAEADPKRLVGLVTGYLESGDGETSSDGYQLIAAALASAFPCAK